MNKRKIFRFERTKRYSKRFYLVPIGAILLGILATFRGFCQESPEPEKMEKLPHSQKIETEKYPPEVKQIRDWVRSLKEITEARLRLQNEQGMLLDRLSELKEKNAREEMGPNKVMSRRQLEKTAEELHKILEQDRRNAREQKEIMENLLSNKTQAVGLIGKEIEEIRKKIERAEKNRDTTPERINQLKKNLEELEGLQTLLDILGKSPHTYAMQGFGPGAPLPAPDKTAWHPGKFAEMRKGDFQQEGGARDRAGVRIFQQISQMERQIQFLRNQMDRIEANFNNLKETLNKIRERHPEIIEELRRDNPDLFQERITEPDPDFESPPRMFPEKKRMPESSPPQQNPQ
ncbi:hypothetical protein JW926_00855 [Candidatus Sumerlaeota bacterium]|nr:hypothetical protein [Candidatus Sumerlaeota bacterium]